MIYVEPAAGEKIVRLHLEQRRSLRSLSGEFNLSVSVIRRVIRHYKEDCLRDGEKAAALRAMEENGRLKRQNEELRKERDFWKINGAVDPKGKPASKYSFVDRYRAQFGLNWLLKKLGIYPNGYYNYKKKRRAAYQSRKSCALELIGRIYRETGGRPGYRMMTAMLAERGVVLSAQTVHRYMNGSLGLRSVTRKKSFRRAGTDAPYKTFANLLERNFTASRRNEKWCVDFTYLVLSGGAKRYNCTIIDLYDRRVVASVNGARIDTKLALAALKKAIERSGGGPSVVLHSDRGSQFTARDFIRFCSEHGITQSMSRPGCPYDNAPMERYFNTLKAELLNLHRYKSESEMFDAVTAYAYIWYNRLRPHSYNGNLPPCRVV